MISDKAFPIWLDELYLKISEHQTGNPNTIHYIAVSILWRNCKNWRMLPTDWFWIQRWADITLCTPAKVFWAVAHPLVRCGRWTYSHSHRKLRPELAVEASACFLFVCFSFLFQLVCYLNCFSSHFLQKCMKGLRHFMLENWHDGLPLLFLFVL